MAYLVLESSVRTHRKFLAAGPAASWLWVCGLGYCQEGLTDGFIPRAALDFLGVKGAEKLAERLVRAGLWDIAKGGWEVHDYLEHNRSADAVRELMRRRAEGGRKGGRPRKTLEVTPSETLEVINGETLEGNLGLPTAITLPETLSGSSGSSVLPTDQDPDQDPRFARYATMYEVRNHLKAAAHRFIDADEQITESDLADELKTVAAKLRAAYSGREIQTVIDAVRGERQRRHA